MLNEGKNEGKCNETNGCYLKRYERD